MNPDQELLFARAKAMMVSLNIYYRALDARQSELSGDAANDSLYQRDLLLLADRERKDDLFVSLDWVPSAAREPLAKMVRDADITLSRRDGTRDRAAHFSLHDLNGKKLDSLRLAIEREIVVCRDPEFLAEAKVADWVRQFNESVDETPSVDPRQMRDALPRHLAKTDPQLGNGQPKGFADKYTTEAGETGPRAGGRPRQTGLF